MKQLSIEQQAKTTGGGLFGFLALGVIAGLFVWGVANFVKDVIIEGEQFDMTHW